MTTGETQGQVRAFDEQQVQAFRARLRGELLQPGDEGYDEARRVWNAMIDKRPALIARCAGTADVVFAVNFARDHELAVSVRGGGHNVAGNAVCDDGLMIDLSLMTGIHVDAGRRLARVQPGATWGDLDHETQLHGLIAPGGVVSTTGIAGLTLGGGLSATRRKWGLSCDNLVSAEVVVADGQLVNASEVSNPDLFWAIRGGGGDVGIVTSFEFALHSLGPEMYIAAPIYPLDGARDIVRAWRDYIEQAPDEVSSDLIFWSMPPLPGIDPDHVGTPIVIAAGWYAGSVSGGELTLQPIRELGRSLADLSHVGQYVDIQRTFDSFFPDTQRYYWKSLFVDSLTDHVIDAMVEYAAQRPSTQSMMVLRALGGAISHMPAEATAYGNRNALYNLSVDTTWQNVDDDERMVSWTRQAWSRMRDMTSGGVYMNFAGFEEEGETLSRAAYGPNYERLKRIKREYDPGYLIGGNLSTQPE